MARSRAIIGTTGSTARVNSVCAKTTRATIFRTGGMAELASGKGQPMATYSVGKEPRDCERFVAWSHFLRKTGSPLFRKMLLPNDRVRQEARGILGDGARILAH